MGSPDRPKARKTSSQEFPTWPHFGSHGRAVRLPGVARTWLSIRVELIEGGGRTLWPRSGRLFAAARSYTFAALAEAIDTAFARWDRAHLCLFKLTDGTDVCGPIPWDDPPEGSVQAPATRLSRLAAGEQFLYIFDMGDDWTHLCTVADERIDPLGIIPSTPLPEDVPIVVELRRRS